LSVSEKKGLIDITNSKLCINRQCELLGLNRSSFYYEPLIVSDDTVEIMNLVDEIYTRCPFYGSRRIKMALIDAGISIGRERVQSLMRDMGICAIYPKPKLSRRNYEHSIYPYLLKGYTVKYSNEVWSTDITYIRLKRGFLYLAAVIDWYSRYVISWKLSNSLESGFCIEVLKEALKTGRPVIFNTDQGVQFTSKEFTGILEGHNIKISMDSKGRALDNIFVERLWRSVKYEEVYIKGYDSCNEAKEGLNNYFTFYNTERYHQSLGYKTPHQVHYNL
jgi:putative transposase